MQISLIKDFNVWNQFLKENNSPTFLQSWEWGTLQINQGHTVFNLGIYNDDELLGVALVIKVKAKRGSFIFLPHGPIITQRSNVKSQNLLIFLRDYLIKLAKDERCSFIRISPILEKNNDNLQLFKDLGFKKAPIHMHAETVWVLPLEKTEDEILGEMRKTTRYLIKKAVRDGVIIEKTTNEKAVDEFLTVYEKTAEREKFTPFSKKFITQEFLAFNKSGNALFITARHEERLLASALVIFTPYAGFYHQGASIHTKIPAPYLLQWEAVKESKSRGCKYYNFWGIAPEDKPYHPWIGLSLFKKGFGGHSIEYLPAQDYVVSPKYYLTSFYESLLRRKRGM